MKELEALNFLQEGGMLTYKSNLGEVILKFTDTVLTYRFKDEEHWRKLSKFDLDATYEEYVEPKPLTGWEQVAEGHTFGSIAANAIVSTMECGYHRDLELYSKANYFSTESKAEEINFKQILFRKLRRFSDENGGNEINWKDNYQNKFIICYDHEDRKIRVLNYNYTNHFGGVYFISREAAEKAVELFHDDLIKYFTTDWNTSEKL